MAIEFHPKIRCEDCEAAFKSGEMTLRLTPAQRDVLSSILINVSEMTAEGTVTMSAVDLVDFKDLIEKVEDL